MPTDIHEVESKQTSITKPPAKVEGPCWCGAEEYTILEGDDFWPGYTGYGVTSCCHSV
jgi:hypothetical protein